MPMLAIICRLWPVLLLALATPVILAAPSDSAGDSGSVAPAVEPDLGGADGVFDSRAQVRVSVVPERTKVAPGGHVPIAVIFDHNPGWHVQANRSRDPDAMVTVIEVKTPDDGPLIVHDQNVQWPEVKLGKFGGGVIESEVFDGKAIAYIPVSVRENARLGPTSLEIRVRYQACDDKVCLQDADEIFTAPIEIVSPQQAVAGAVDPAIFRDFDPKVWSDIAAGRTGPKPVSFDLFGLQFSVNAAGGIGIVLLLLLAALGGFLLNLTPCVLPVIPIKIMSLSAGGGHRGRTLLLGFIMSLGIVAFWLAIGALIAFSKSFTAINQLFQYPLFSVGVGVFIAIMAIGMCGVFSLQLPQFIMNISPKQESVPGSFGFGIMTAVLSTPCTAPFMGAAAAWAATQKNPPLILIVFAAIGIGMALPYLVLAAFPKLTKKMPRTGPASELIKQVMGLLMLAAAAYFVGVGLSGLLVSPPDPPSLMYWWVVAAFSAMAGAWLIWRTVRIAHDPLHRILFGAVGLLVIAISAFIALRMTDKGPIDWTYYTAQRFADAKREGKVVVMEFTAEWCLNCKALEQSVLRDSRVVKLLGSDGVAPIKVDLTGNNVDGNAMLRDVDRLTIPLLVVFSPDGREIFKGDYYTSDQVVQAVADAAGPQVAARP
jgi:thiol:disulfide interchange protein DsbD